MRVKIIRWTDPTSSQATLRVQRWCDGQWEPVRDFGLHESEQAHEFAMKLSMFPRAPVEVAVYQDGQKLEPPRVHQFQGPVRGYFETGAGRALPDNEITEKVPENRS